jgi:hypothetical protein
MKKTSLLILSGFIILAVALIQCNGGDKKTETDESAVNTITPVPLPTNIVPGFNYPEDSTVILGWTNDSTFANRYDSASIYKHAWGIWAGLTAPSGQKYAGDNLRVYETWLGLSEVQKLVIENNMQGGCAGTSFKRNGRAPLSRAKQLEHSARFIAKKTGFAVSRPTASETNVNFWVTVSYSPDAACFATQNQIFKQSVVNKSYNAGGLGAIPAFPNKSITIKPTYLVYDDTAVLFKVPVWITAPVTADSNFGQTGNGFEAKNFVYVDRNNKQPAGKIAVPVGNTEKEAAKIAAATINLNDFIYLTIDAQMAKEMNSQDSAQGMNNGPNGYGVAKKGQIALLMAMHVTTKEISNWTWQSYYWTPNRENPGSPSSNLAASLRPSQIKGAAANYACVAAYVMLTPNNAPNSSAKGSMFGYNPYLEGGFGPSTFPYANTFNATYKYGVQSNCMSCHALAIADTSASGYTTDQTVSLAAPYFNKQVSLDFAWSVQTALINDTIPYWQWKK